MPTVPVSDNVVPMTRPQRGGEAPPSPTMFAMAAALMHQQGRLLPKDKDDSGK